MRETDINTKPLISNITVFYSSKKTIRDIIESVLNKSYPNI